jgi:hypothetical protein
MTHKQNCISFCREQLQDLDLLHYFNMPHFEHVYRKQKGAQGNAFVIGSKAADFIIFNSKFTNHDERKNESEA